MDSCILTPSIRSKLVDLAHCLHRCFPVLIEGSTSAGKTSSIEHLARRPEDRTSVREVKIIQTLFTMCEGSPTARLGLKFERSSVWMSAFQLLLILVATSLQHHHEPVLLVGGTGAGKTSVCQYFVDVLGRELHTLNCHQNTETADQIGVSVPSAFVLPSKSMLAGRLWHAWNNAAFPFLIFPPMILEATSLPSNRHSNKRDGHPQMLKSLDKVAAL